jgi:hypothetical protein
VVVVKVAREDATMNITVALNSRNWCICKR